MSLTFRGVKTGFANAIWLLLILVAVIFLNLIASRVPWRADLTHDNRYTLAEPSIEIARDLPGPVSVEVFFSEDLPPQFEQMTRDITDLLTDYSSASDGKLTFEFIDPDASDDHRTRAEDFGVPSWPLQVSGESEFSVKVASTGIVFLYDNEDGEEQVEVIERMLPGGNYEYDLTRALRDVVTDPEEGRIKLGIAIGIGGFLDQFLDIPMNPQNPISPDQIKDQIKEQLGMFFEGLYDFELVDISEAEVSDDVTGLFVIGPTAEHDDEMLRRIDAFVMSGRPVAFFLSPYKMETQNFDQPGFGPIDIPAENDTGLEELIETYGVRLNEDAIVELNLMSAQVSVEEWIINMGGRQARVPVPIPDPRLPVMTLLSPTSLIVPQMPMVAFLPMDRERPLSQSSLSLTADAFRAAGDDELVVEEVMRTSESTFRYVPGEPEERILVLDKEDLTSYLEAYEANPDDPDVRMLLGIDEDEDGNIDDVQTESVDRGPFVVGYSLVGFMESHFPGAEEVEDDPEVTSSTDSGRIFVVANGHWIESLLTQRNDPLLNPNAMRMMDPGAVRQVQQYLRSGEMLFRNTADWLAQDTALVQIRVREEPAYIDSDRLTEWQKMKYKLFNIAGIPILFSFLGLCGFLVRQFRRGRIEAIYAAKDRS